MPIFEQDSEPPRNGDGNAGGVSGEFRPRRRDAGGPRQRQETFTPAKIPAKVKGEINDKISDMVRQSRGPDETFFAFREFFSSVVRGLRRIPRLLLSIFSKKARGNEDFVPGIPNSELAGYSDEFSDEKNRKKYDGRGGQRSKRGRSRRRGGDRRR